MISVWYKLLSRYVVDCIINWYRIAVNFGTVRLLKKRGSLMIGEKMYYAILTLKKAGKSYREIATLLNVSKSTINKYLNLSEVAVKELFSNQERQSNFDVSNDFVTKKLTVFPNMRITKLYKLTKREYPQIGAKQRAFYNFVKKIKADISPEKFRKYKPVINDNPGKQIQVDPGECYFLKNETEKQKVYFVSFIMSYSRKAYAYFQTQPFNTDDFIKAHLAAFQYYGCITTEYVYDQTKLVVIKEVYREIEFNNKFHNFAIQNGFYPRVCEGYDPESKGKVERQVQEVKKDFIEGEFFVDLSDLRKRSLDWFDEVDNRVHGTTRQKPKDLFKEDYENSKQYFNEDLATRFVDKEGLISYKSNKYSVPHKYQRQEIKIKIENNFLIFFDKDVNSEIAKHKIVEGKCSPIINNNHYRNYRESLEDLILDTKKKYSSFQNGEKLVENVLNNNPKIKRDQARALSEIFENIPLANRQILIDKAVLLNNITAWKFDKMRIKYNEKELLQELKKKEVDNQKIETSTLLRSVNFYEEVAKNDNSCKI